MNCDECRYWKWGGYTHREHGDLGVCSLKLPPNGPPSKLGAPTRVTYGSQGCDLGRLAVQGGDGALAAWSARIDSEPDDLTTEAIVEAIREQRGPLPEQGDDR